LSAPNFIFVPPRTIIPTHLFSTLRHGVLQQVDVNFCHLLWLLSPSFPNFLSPFTQAKKDEQLLKKRNLQVEPDETPLQESNKTVPLDLSLPAIISNINSPSPEAQFSGVQSCRKLLSKEKNPPIDAVIGSGVVSKLVEFLARADK
jgi:hypothetical protein